MRGDRVDADMPRKKSSLGTPAVRALLFQLLALLLTLATTIGLLALGGVQFSLVAGALMQGVFAALLSRRSLAPWWMGIQFLFPVGVVSINALQLPPSIFLVAFLVFVVLYWSTFRTQVPFYPSNYEVWNTVSELLPKDRPIRFIDIGSGFGGLVLHLAAKRSDCEFEGIELAPLPWLSSRFRARIQGSSGRFLQGDYNALDFAGFDMIFAYLSPAAMPALWQKARSEMRSGTLLLSYEFLIPGVEPQLALKCGKRGEILYGWKM